MVMPKGWTNKAIESFPATVVSGGTPSTFVSEYWDGDIPWMNSGELNLKRVRSVKGRITLAGLLNSSTCKVPPTSVLIGLAGQGKTRGTVAMNYLGLCTNQSIASILPNPKVFDSEYLYQNLDSRYGELRELSTGDGGRGGLNLTIIRNLVVPFPPLPEQHAIAAALSDADAYIDTLEKLITKKRAMKQGAMQELLTGKRRLPGFEGEWAVKKLCELADIVSGATPKTSVNEYWDGNIIWVVPTDITGQRQKYLSSSERKITKLGLSQSGAALLPAGTILLCSRATIGDLAIAAQPTATNQGFKNLVCFPETDNEYLYYAIQPLRFKMIERASGSTFLEISKTALGEIEVCVPSTKDEQTAIAAVLSDMDAEIDALTEKLSKAKHIKQGMMSELLTGRIRLIQEETDNG